MSSLRTYRCVKRNVPVFRNCFQMYRARVNSSALIIVVFQNNGYAIGIMIVGIMRRKRRFHPMKRTAVIIVVRIRIFFLLRGESHWDPRTQSRWPITLYLPFKFIGGCLRVQSPYRRPQSRSASPLLFVPDPSW